MPTSLRLQHQGVSDEENCSTTLTDRLQAVVDRGRNSAHVQSERESPSVPPRRTLPMQTTKKKTRETVKSFFKGFDSIIEPSQDGSEEVSPISNSQADRTRTNRVRLPYSE